MWREPFIGMMALRQSVQRGRPFGEEPWSVKMVKNLGLEGVLRWLHGFWYLFLPVGLYPRAYARGLS